MDGSDSAVGLSLFPLLVLLEAAAAAFSLGVPPPVTTGFDAMPSMDNCDFLVGVNFSFLISTTLFLVILSQPAVVNFVLRSDFAAVVLDLAAAESDFNHFFSLA